MNQGIKNAAYVIGMAVSTLIEALGMVAENQLRMQNGQSIAYGEGAFKKLLEDNCMHHNGIVKNLNG